MRTFRFVSLISTTVALVLSALLCFTSDNAVRAEGGAEESGIIINEMEPGAGECMPGDNTVVLIGAGLTAPEVQVKVLLPGSNNVVPATIVGSIATGIRTRIPQSTWKKGTYIISVFNSQRQKASFSFWVRSAGGLCRQPRVDSQLLSAPEPTPDPTEGFARGDGQ